MKVYVVLIGSNVMSVSDIYVLGIYSTKEKAETAIQEYRKREISRIGNDLFDHEIQEYIIVS